MDGKVISKIFRFTQSLGSHEDLATGALATMFYYSPELTKKLLLSEKTLLKKIPASNGGKIDEWLDKGHVGIVQLLPQMIGELSSKAEQVLCNEILEIMLIPLVPDLHEGASAAEKLHSALAHIKRSMRAATESINPSAVRKCETIPVDGFGYPEKLHSRVIGTKVKWLKIKTTKDNHSWYLAAAVNGDGAFEFRYELWTNKRPSKIVQGPIPVRTISLTDFHRANSWFEAVEECERVYFSEIK